MTKSGKSFYEISIKEQMRVIASVTIVLFVILCFLINASVKQLVNKNANEHVETTSLRLRDEIEFTYDKIRNFSISIGEDTSVQQLMTCDYSEISMIIGDVKNCLVKHMILESTIKDIALVNDNIHYSSIYTKNEMDEIRAASNGKAFQWLGIRKNTLYTSTEKKDMLVYARDIIVDMENIGTIIISIDASSYIVENESEENALYFLADDSEILFSMEYPMEKIQEVHQIWRENGYPARIDKKGYYIHSYYFEDMGCYLISVLDTKSTQIEMNQIEILSWSSVVLVVAFCVSFFVFLLKAMVQPLGKFMDTMKQIRELHQKGLKSELELRGCAEITEIGKEFSGMLYDIEILNKKIFQSATDLYELKVQKQEAELAYLRSQIDPHFLYNTLEVVRKMALTKDAPEIAQTVIDMANIFRYSTKGEDYVPLEKEISIIKSYIRIQQMRFLGKIDAFYFISEEVLHLKVMKMLLQPIVENSIFHGLEPQSGNGSLFIGARKENDQLIITVKDDGVGIEKSKLEEIQKNLTMEYPDTSKHVGILNTNARIRLLYGKDYGISIESCTEDGTTVTLRLPVNE